MLAFGHFCLDNLIKDSDAKERAFGKQKMTKNDFDQLKDSLVIMCDLLRNLQASVDEMRAEISELRENLLDDLIEESD